EDRLSDEPRDPGAWASYSAFLERYKTALEGEQRRIEDRLGIDEGSGSIDMSFRVPDGDEDAEDLAGAIEAGRELLEWYAASDLPSELSAFLAMPGLRTPSLAEQAAPTLLTEFTAEYKAARTASVAEAFRARLALTRGDTASVASATGNIVGMMRLHEGQPVIIAMLVRVAINAMTNGQVLEAIRAGEVPPESARELLPVYNAWIADEPGRTRVHLEGEELFTLSTLSQIYAGELTGDDLGFSAARVLWHNHKSMDEAARRFFADAIVYTEAGPANGTPVAMPWDESSRISEFRHGPLAILLPAIDRASYAAFNARLENAVVTTHLAMLAYHDTTGTLPASLDDLVEAGLLDAPPADPFSPSGLLGYRLDDSVPGGFLLWSAGPDLTDNNGEGPAWLESFEYEDLPDGQDLTYPLERTLR
ncbi:MAG: hypothetical protein AAGH64_11240, partial [Planctomycetota bacterium]